jgi:AcrR family transcriptional regulator
MVSKQATHDAGSAEDKRRRILECAFDVALRYGYQRMTMDDVAKACGMSRPALYLQFKNKGEIYKAIVSDMMGRALDDAQRALDGPGDISVRLFAAIKSGILDPVDFLQATAHGAELLDMKHELAGEVIADWRAKKAAMIAAALDESGAAKAKGFAGDQLADILLDGIDGLKMRAKSAQERHDGAKALVTLICGLN